ncbi:type III-B CRISPR-associated protein Cas10/Cmr2 [Haliovirga abyssi]|uniref:Type III-B CRISPR-associated protein Cas10/Cmr2 n=1 Tax=Haliovirga abyssi TaxID=2996794 RepID=A0AAU9DHB4_9FUSO|nr:type III-B CRISPR-associated protein Cas10/Cmr2 [Haliovirga abyssi]BDU50902.1 type III-B CRISPR-associated protein Cas10/Cmr2 [Haliovirga abyssi]
MTKYIGVTIGPIVDTISRAKKTRSAWRTSYMFSYIMKKIIWKLKQDNRIELILPYSKDDSIYTKPKKAGLFHDRLIIEVKKDFKLKDLVEIKDSVFEEFAKNAFKDNLDKKTKEEFIKYLDTYINFYALEKELDSKDNIILEISKYLDVMELQPQICFMQFEENKDYLFDFINDVSNDFLEKDAFEEGYEIKSLPEIAFTDIYKKSLEKVEEIDKEINKGKEDDKYPDDEKCYEIFKESMSAEFKKHHKYYAVVRADGDGIGAIIKELKVKEDYQNFSNILFEFAKESVEEIEIYGGLPIFAGGDDLLFFAPIINSSCNEYKNIFELTTALSNIFEEKLKNLKGKTNKKGTLSFGITINYYKYPLYEAYNNSATLLFEKAKKYKGKNATAVKLLKGGNKPIEFILSKAEKEKFQEFLKIFNYDNKDKKLIKGVIYTLENQIELLKLIQNDEEKLTNFFINNFKKEIHTDKTQINGLVREINKILQLVINYGKKEETENLLKLLRFLMFLTERGDE